MAYQHHAISRHEDDAAVAAFIRAKGVTRCPTACVVRTQGSPAAADRQALQLRAERFEAQLEEKLRRGRARRALAP
jgi:hypothetical protein